MPESEKKDKSGADVIGDVMTSIGLLQFEMLWLMSTVGHVGTVMATGTADDASKAVMLLGEDARDVAVACGKMLRSIEDAVANAERRVAEMGKEAGDEQGADPRLS